MNDLKFPLFDPKMTFFDRKNFEPAIFPTKITNLEYFKRKIKDFGLKLDNCCIVRRENSHF